MFARQFREKGYFDTLFKQLGIFIVWLVPVGDILRSPIG